MKLIFCLFFSIGIQSQTIKSSNFWDNVRFGGGIGINFGDGFFSGSIAPSGIYDVNPYVSVGLGLNFSYNSEEDFFNSTILGGSIIGLVNPYPEIQLSMEFEQLNVDQNFDNSFVSNVDENFWVPALYLGIGYRQGPVTFGIRYDVLYDEDDSVYAEPWFPFVRFWF